MIQRPLAGVARAARSQAFIALLLFPAECGGTDMQSQDFKGLKQEDPEPGASLHYISKIQPSLGFIQNLVSKVYINKPAFLSIWFCPGLKLS